MTLAELSGSLHLTLLWHVESREGNAPWRTSSEFRWIKVTRASELVAGLSPDMFPPYVRPLYSLCSRPASSTSGSIATSTASASRRNSDSRYFSSGLVSTALSSWLCDQIPHATGYWYRSALVVT